MKNTNYKIQNDTLDKIKPALDKAKIKWVLVFDEDVLDRLDGDPRLAKLTPEIMESIKNDTVDALMEAWADCIDSAIDNNIN